MSIKILAAKSNRDSEMVELYDSQNKTLWAVVHADFFSTTNMVSPLVEGQEIELEIKMIGGG